MADDIYEEMQELAADAPAFTPRQLTNPNNRWLVRSALQKAIRRGQTDEALRLGEYFITVDEDNAWRSLATIIIEDVGFGDLDLVSYSTLSTLKSVRSTMHDEMLYAGMIAKACAADKTRSCCELSLGAEKRIEGAWLPPEHTTPEKVVYSSYLSKEVFTLDELHMLMAGGRCS